MLENTEEVESGSIRASNDNFRHKNRMGEMSERRCGCGPSIDNWAEPVCRTGLYTSGTFFSRDSFIPRT